MSIYTYVSSKTNCCCGGLHRNNTIATEIIKKRGAKTAAEGTAETKKETKIYSTIGT